VGQGLKDKFDDFFDLQEVPPFENKYTKERFYDRTFIIDTFSAK